MFQEALIESLPHRTQRVGTLLASASVHAVVLGALVWISLQAVGEIESPPTIIYKVGPMPPPLGEGGRKHTVSKVPPRLETLPRAAVHPEQIQPTRDTTPDTSSTSSNEPKELSDSEKSGGGEQEPGKGGDPNGDASDTTISVIGTGDVAIPLSRVDQRPVLLTRIDPIYPEAARKGHLSGMVVLQAVINTAGLVEDLRVMKSAGQLLDAAAISAVERWIYRPATLNARAVKVYLTVTVDFTLH